MEIALSETSRNHKPSLSIALVNYKTPEITKICLDLIKKSVDVKEVPVFVVDNNSNDASLAYLKSLDWIYLLERKSTTDETGHMAHGCGLDMALEQVTTDFLLLLHTDTLIYDSKIIDVMLGKINSNPQIAAVGCLEQSYRTALASTYTWMRRAIKYYYRRMKMVFGIKTRAPILYYEIYLKSFCALWNVNIIKRHHLYFSMNKKIPGYEMQNVLSNLGYQFISIPPFEMFKYLDHIEAGTVSMVDKLSKKHKRIRNRDTIIKKYTATTP